MCPCLPAAWSAADQCGVRVCPRGPGAVHHDLPGCGDVAPELERRGPHRAAAAHPEEAVAGHPDDSQHVIPHVKLAARALHRDVADAAPLVTHAELDRARAGVRANRGLARSADGQAAAPRITHKGILAEEEAGAVVQPQNPLGADRPANREERLPRVDHRAGAVRRERAAAAGFHTNAERRAARKHQPRTGRHVQFPRPASPTPKLPALTFQTLPASCRFINP